MLCRANLDIVWSRDTSTVKGILGYTKEIVRRARKWGRLVPYLEINNWTVRYKVDMGMAI